MFKIQIVRVDKTPLNNLKEGSAISTDKPTINLNIAGMERDTNDLDEAMKILGKHGGKAVMWLPMVDGNFTILSIITEEVEVTSPRSSILASLLGARSGVLGPFSMSDIMGGGRGGLDLGSLLASALAAAGTADKYADALKDDDKVLVIGSGTRDGKDDFEVSVSAYRRLKELDMVDECDACSSRLSRLVIHPEGDYTLAQVKEFVEAEYPNA